MKVTPLEGFLSEETFCTFPATVSRARRESDGTQAIVYEIAREPLPQGELEQYRNNKARVMAIANTPTGIVLAIASAGVPLCATSLPLGVEAFLSVASQLVEALAQAHEDTGFYRHLNNATVILTPGNGASLAPAPVAHFLSQSRSHGETGVGHEVGSMALWPLQFMAPEQTGRMNIAPDTRTDFYSLGVAFYQMLTGHLPFESADVLELMHSHLARSPRSPHELNPAIPTGLSHLIIKLLAKTPDERYEGTFGLRADLNECKRQWKNTGNIEAFPLGQSDISERLAPPPRLYGRDTEIELLHDAFDVVRDVGHTTLFLIGGYSGIGKTALAQVLRPNVTQVGGTFLSGKIDQFRRNMPYASIAEAFRGLVRQLQTTSEDRLAALRNELLQAFDGNGQVIANVIPEIEFLIGPQPPLPELNANESQARFHRVFQAFIKVIALPGRPLVLFLDDLQWMDAASLKFMEVLVESKLHLLLIGAYRDNEVSPSHPLVATIARVENASRARIHQLTLTPLAEDHVAQLLADTLRRSRDAVTSLAHLLVARTDGNAFFLLQFLQQLHAQGLLHFDRQQGRWIWDESQIARAEISGDVVELMATKIRTLSPAARSALPVAACLGNRFDVETLALVRGQSREELFVDLQEARESQLLLATSEAIESVPSSFRFLHDRVQQAAYSLLSETEKTAIHARTGYILAEQSRSAGRGAFEEQIFEIADHLNRGRTKGDDSDVELAEINLLALRRAKNALAYEAASRYALSGIKALPIQYWNAQHELAFALHLDLCECLILQGRFSNAEPLFEVLHQHASDRFQKARIYLLQLTAYTTQTRMAEAAQTGIEALRHFGVHLPLHPGKGEIIQEVLLTRRNLGFRRPSDLLNSPRMSDPTAIATVQLINGTLAAAFQSDVLLWTLLTLKTVSLTLRFGITEGTPTALANYAIVLCAPLGQFRAGLDFVETSMRLSDRNEFSDTRSQAYFTAGSFIAFWHDPIPHGIKLLRHSYEVGPENGEFVYSSYSAVQMVFHCLFQGNALAEVDGLIDEYLDFVKRVQYKEGPEYLGFFRQFIACLQGRTESLGSFANGDYDESSHVREISGYVNKLPLMYYTALKLEALYLLGRTEEARQVAARYERDPKNIEQLSSMLFNPAFHFYNAMTMATLYSQALTRQKRRYRISLEVQRRKFQKWAGMCPANFAHLAALLGAELHRMQGRWREAQHLYEDAVDLAEKHGFLHHAALGHERVGTMHLQLASRTRASYHLTAAHAGYAKWGAKAKVQVLEQTYGLLLNLTPFPPVDALPTKPEAAPSSLATSAQQGAVSASLDLGTVVKASQAISGEIEWAHLLRVLMNVAIENAGAQRGVLLIENQNELRLAAEGATGAIEVRPLEGRALGHSESQIVPLSVVNYVARTRESVLLADAQTDELFSHDGFIVQNGTRSLLCMPIVNQGQLVGVLYLENNLVEGVFTEDRLRVLKLLAAQAAVSLEATRAYASVRKSQMQLQAILDNATTVIYMKDLQGHYLMINDQFARLFKITKEQAVGANALDFVSPSIAAKVSSDDEHVLRTHEPVQWEETFNFDGEERTYITVKFPLFDAEGSIYAIGAVATDITERKRAEEVLANYSHALEEQVEQRTLELRENNQRLQLTLEQLQDAQQRMILQENLAYLGTLTAGVAHEIQNPLNFVINFAQVSSILVDDLRSQIDSLQEESPTPLDPYLVETVDDLEQNAAKINEHGQRINNIVKSMLLHSRGVSPAPAPAHVNALLKEAIDLVYHALRAEKPDINISFDTQFDPILDVQPTSVVAQDLSRVFTNIIGNAVYAVLKKQERDGNNFVPMVTLTTRSAAEKVEIRIRDNGSGIATSQREEIFKPFFTTKPTGEGTGLGLSISYNIVTQEHRGELRVNSKTEEEDHESFTEFVICLPQSAPTQ